MALSFKFAVEGSSSTSLYYSHNFGRGQFSIERSSNSSKRQKSFLYIEEVVVEGFQFLSSLKKCCSQANHNRRFVMFDCPQDFCKAVAVASASEAGGKRREAGRRTCLHTRSKSTALHTAGWFVFGVLFLRIL